MSDTVPTRVHFYEGQFLRAVDFTAEQAYHLQGLRRHNLAGHRWGIVSGLEVVLDEAGDLSVQAGLAVDGYGRTLILPIYRSISPNAFDDQASDTLEIWLLYDRRPGEAAAAGYAACNDDRQPYREIESARVEVRAPDPNQIPAGGSDIPDGRRPLQVDPDDLSFGPTRTPPDDAGHLWPVYLGRVERTEEGELRVDLSGRPYAGLVGEFVRSPSGKAFLQIGAERPDDPNRFAIYLDPGEDRPSPLPLPGKLPDLAIEQNGQIKIYHDTTLYGDLTVDGGAVVFNGGPEYLESQPWRIYHTASASGDGPGVTVEQLRVEMAQEGSPGEVVIGHWSAQKKKFVPCLTIDNDCTVTVHGDLELQGNMEVAGEIIQAGQTAMAFVSTMAQELGSAQTPVMNALVRAIQANQPVMMELLARLAPFEVLHMASSRTSSVGKESGIMDMDQVKPEEVPTPPETAFQKEEVPPAKAGPEGPPLEPDDLTRLPGIGPTFAGKLQAAGIRRYEDIQTKSNNEIKEILGLRSFQKLDFKSLRNRAARLAAARDDPGEQDQGEVNTKEPTESEDDEA
jgi:predicted flap endonuclease-1-like 5' DNA nuclease